MKEFTINKLRHLWLFMLLSVVSTAAFAQNPQTFADLQTKANVGGSVVLGGDILYGASEGPLLIPENIEVVLDLNGYTLTTATSSGVTAIRLQSGATLTIKDSSAGGTGKVTSKGRQAVDIAQNATGATLTIKSGQFESQEMTIATLAGVTNSTITIEGGTFTANDNAVLGGNGTNIGEATGNTWNVSGGTFKGGIQSAGYVACGIYAPNKDTWNITGGTFNIAGGAGIVQRAGTVTVGENVKINTTGDVTGKVGDSRVVVPCAALVFDAYKSGYPGLSDASQMVVNGGKFRSESNVVAVLHGEKDNNKTSGYPNIRVQVNGGDFKENDNDMGAVGMNPGEIILAVNNSDLDENDFAPISSDNLVVTPANQTYTYNGAAQVPVLTVTLNSVPQTYDGENTGASDTYGITIYKKEGNEYAAVQAVNAGDYLYVVNCNGESATGTFTINPFNLESAVLNGDDFTYNGNVQKPRFVAGENPTTEPVTHTVSVILSGTTPTTLDYDKDYTVEYLEGADYTHNGSKNFILKAKEGSNYTHPTTPTAGVELSYQIKKAQVEASLFTLASSTLPYTGVNQQPEVEVVSGTFVTMDDVTVSQPTKKNVGTGYSVTITGNGNGEGTGDIITGTWNEGHTTFTADPIQISSFAITKAPITAENVQLTLPDPAFVYDGAVHKLPEVEGKTPSIVVTATLVAGAEPTTLVEGDDYDVIYTSGGDYTNAGNKSVYVRGKGNYASFVEGTATEPEEGDIELTYPIEKVDLATEGSAIFKLNSAFTYNEESHPTSDEYTASFKGAAGDAGPELISSDDYTVVYDEGGNKTAGDHQVIFRATENSTNFKGQYEKTIHVGEYAITINAAQLYKTYGEKDNEATTSTGQKANYGDPDKYAAVDFTIDNNSGVQNISDDEKKHILEYLEFARANGDNGENAGDHDYLLKTKANMEGCNFTITIQHNTSKLIIRKAPLTINVDVDDINVNVRDNWKYFGENDPLVDYNGGKSFAFDISNASQLKNGDTKETAILSLTREAGEKVGEYPFVVDAPNYEVTIEEPDYFTIRPTSNANNVEVAFTPASYQYIGGPLEPAPVVIYHNPLTGNDDILKKDRDYEYTSASYTNNVNVTPNIWGNKAKLTVKLINNFDNVNKEGTFDITKAPLTITANSYEKTTGEGMPTATTLVNELKWTGLLGQDLATGNVEDGKPNFSDNAPKLKAPTVKIVATTYQDVYDVVVNADAVADNYTLTSSLTTRTLFTAKILRS